MRVVRAARGYAPAMIGVLGLLAAPGCELGKPKPAAEKAAKSDPVVLVSRPTSGEFTDFEDFTGRVEAVLSVEVRARVTGYLDKVHFEDGAEVAEGALLFEIDPRPYKAAFDRSVALLEQAKARQQRAEADSRRLNALYNRGAASREEFDAITSALAEAHAAVGVAQADRDLTELNLTFTRVTAPIAGRLSRRMVDPGNLVKADDTALTSIVSLDPMFVYFDMDERTMLRIRRLIREGKIKSRTEAEVPVLAGLADEEGFPHAGTIDFSDNKVDPNTGTLRVRGVIKNPAPRVLSPGLFIRVRLPIGKPREALMVPEQAVGTDQGRKFLYVVNDRREVASRPVQVGLLNEGMRVIEKGLEPTDRVVVGGLQRIRPGTKVVPKPAEEVAAGPDADADALAKRKGPAATPGG